MFKVLIGSSSGATSRGLSSAIESEEDFEVCGIANTRADVLSKAKVRNPSLIILDRQLLPKDGFEAVETLRKELPKVPIFLISGRPGMAAEKEAFSHGVDVVFAVDHDWPSVIENARAVLRKKEKPQGLTGHSISAAEGDPSIYIGKLFNAGSAPVPKSPLSPREKQIVGLLVEDKTNKEIARALGLSKRTVEAYRGRAYRKLNATGLGAVIRYAIRNRIIRP
jgi:two-component system, NarL family, nitrate/nitrite response regulator NarL